VIASPSVRTGRAASFAEKRKICAPATGSPVSALTTFPESRPGGSSMSCATSPPSVISISPPIPMFGLPMSPVRTAYFPGSTPSNE
jgi:hypothetical protein